MNRKLVVRAVMLVLLATPALLGIAYGRAVASGAGARDAGPIAPTSVPFFWILY